MKIHLASDHAGFEIKSELNTFLQERGYEVVDHGAYTYDEVDDYPDLVRKAALNATSLDDRAIILGGSGQGEAIVANRIKGVRATVYYGGPIEIIKLSREHNDANVLSLGARFLDSQTAKEAVTTWLETPFSGEERHLRRINKIDNEAV